MTSAVARSVRLYYSACEHQDREAGQEGHRFSRYLFEQKEIKWKGRMDTGSERMCEDKHEPGARSLGRKQMQWRTSMSTPALHVRNGLEPKLPSWVD